MATNILKITKEYDTQAKCLSYLKSLRWGKTVKCPNCESDLPFYLVEFEWKYDHKTFRGSEFEKLLKNALQHEKDLAYWKAKSTEQVKKIAYGN